ncbi:MAG: Ig domain-containing protein [Bacteroidales bacterium]|nr:Ig domain-containing protein [Bacteroidales bacterium]
MKKILYILMALSLLLCCTREELRPRFDEEEPEEVEGKVLVRMTFDLPEQAPTRALSDTPQNDLTSLWVAVFGRSGYLKEYVQATMVQSPVNNGSVNGNDNRYEFYASLTLSENSERHIHILGNGPEILDYARESELLDTLLSPVRQGGYWQSFIVPGIKGKRDSNGNLIGEDTAIIDGQTVYLGTGHFQIADETLAYFTNVPLIRNFAKIVVEDQPNCNFQTISFAAVNVATQGSMAPYYSGGFVYGYQNKSYTDLVELGYPARLPPQATFDNTVPPASSFVNPTGRSDVTAAGNSFFLYERPVPNDSQPATVVILYGHFTDPDTEDGVDDSGNYYYKVDLMENGVYYPIYRNFKYRISIEKILKPGAESPGDALLSMGSGDVSADISTQKITDISDGTSRILVSYMNKTLIRQYPYEDNEETVNLSLLYKFIPDVTVDANGDGEPDCNNELVANGGPVTISLQSVTGTALITGYEVAAADVDGWREITISTVAPSANILTQYLRVSGQVNGNNPLYRNVTYTMMNTQTMGVHCVPSKVERVQGAELEVDITIPKNLPASMFPLIFNLEASALSLTPDNAKPNNNLPVASGASINPANSDHTFHFVRTLSETEYNQLAAQSSNNTVTVPCYFKTNKAQSASTVYVNDEAGFFIGSSDSFTTFIMKEFSNLSFTSGIPTSQGAATPFHFEMDDSDPLPDRVYFQFTDLRPTGTSGLSQVTDPSDPYYNWYWYSPSETSNAQLNGNYNPTVNLATTTANGTGKVVIEADEYRRATLSKGYAEAVTLNKTSTTIYVGSTETLTATVTPADATNKTVTWTSSDTSVATVSSSGVVTAVGRGTAVITATTVDGGYTASCTVTVKKRVTFNTTNSTLGTGNNKQLSSNGVTVVFSNINTVSGSYVRPGSRSTITISANDGPFTNVTVTFSSSYYTYDFTTDSGSHSLSGTTWTWTGSTSTLVLTNTNSTTRRVASITVEY